jgi:hypothetical protein
MGEQTLVIVFDESISHRICSAFAGFCDGNRILSFRSMARGPKDERWLDGAFPEEPPHVVITKDSVLRPKGQTLAWLRGSLRVAIVDNRLGNMLQQDLAAHLFRWWPVISATVRDTPRQGAFMVPKGFTKRTRLPSWFLKKRPRRVVRKATNASRKKARAVLRPHERQGKTEFPAPDDG